ncbi:MAG: thymidylate synthase [Acidimicrobiia bacterium]|nr:thymidylate synthase [Acidimicrobiia bacterium]
MTQYVAEQFTNEEADILRRYFTNLDQPVFALVNLPEVVKGALFARYSRSAKSLRRLFLDEFVGELDISGDMSIDATVGLRRAEELYDRVFFEYGDDSVAQLGGVHLACEQASNILTKVLEWGRLMSYLEQSTRYIDYLSRIGGRYRYYRDPEVGESPLSGRYVSDMDRMFESYGELLPAMTEFYRQHTPKDSSSSDFAYRQAVRAKALDAVRGLLPAATVSNVGIYGTGQSYELLLLRMRAHDLPEVQTYADLMLTELRKVIPSFLKRVDLEDRGMAWSRYLGDVRESLESVAGHLLPPDLPADDVPAVRLVDFDPEAEVKMVASMLYPYTHLPEEQLEREVRAMGAEDRLTVVRAYVGTRANRRHKPGRALERPFYRFDILADYGAFRDLQRHRMLTLEWQRLTPQHGFTCPEAVDAAGCAPLFNEVMERSAALYHLLDRDFTEQASYAVCLAYKVRFAMSVNARSAMHLIELRTTPQGHSVYRKVGQEMWRLIRDEAGHTAIAEMMKFVDLSEEPPLGRLDAERRAEQRRQVEERA